MRACSARLDAAATKTLSTAIGDYQAPGYQGTFLAVQLSWDGLLTKLTAISSRTGGIHRFKVVWQRVIKRQESFVEKFSKKGWTVSGSKYPGE